MKYIIQKYATKRFLTYVLIGVTAFIADYSLFIIAYKVLDAPIIVANSAGFVAGLALSFLFNRMFTFGGEEQKTRTHHQLFMYVALALCNLVFINLFVSVLKHLSIPPEVAKLMGMTLIVVWNYAVFSRYIFK